jgi:hypothetical protein
MKKIVIIFTLLFLTKIAFSQDTYRERNHKLNKELPKRAIVFTFVKDSTQINTNKIFMKNRKFHKSNTKKTLIYTKLKQEFDYKSRNRKFHKN